MFHQLSSIFSRSRLLTTFASSLLAYSVKSCVQVDLESISNTNGVITDSETIHDELQVWFGISADVLITWQNIITPYETQDFD